MGISFDTNVENEQVVLGSLIADAAQRARFLPRLHDGLFIDEVSVSLLGALRELARRRVDYVADTVVQLTGGDVKFKYLQVLENDFGALPDENLEVHVGILRREAAKDRAREAFGELYESLDDAHSSIDDVEANASAVLRAVRDTSSVGKTRRGKALREEWYKELEELQSGRASLFRPMFFSGLDEELYEGLRPGNVFVLAARPGMGKTTFISNLLLRQILRGKRWLAVPVEPGKEAVIEQMACARARIKAEKVIKTPDELTQKEMFAIKRAARELLDNELLDLNDEMGSLEELEGAVEAADYDGVVIDLWEYLLDDLDPKVVTQKLRWLKRLAKRRKFCAVVVHQIKRIKRVKNPRPMLHELKNSGGYEEVADLAILLHRAKYYKPEVERDVLEFSIAKQRRGPQNVTVGFEFDPSICRVGKHVADFDPRDQQ
jgi:replicative DNA helicase